MKPQNIALITLLVSMIGSMTTTHAMHYVLTDWRISPELGLAGLQNEVEEACDDYSKLSWYAYVAQYQPRITHTGLQDVLNRQLLHGADLNTFATQLYQRLRNLRSILGMFQEIIGETRRSTFQVPQDLTPKIIDLIGDFQKRLQVQDLTEETMKRLQQKITSDALTITNSLRRKEQAERAQAWALAAHPRVGEVSPARVLPEEIRRYIWELSQQPAGQPGEGQ